MRTLPQSSTALPFALVLFAALVSIPTVFSAVASAQTASSQLVCSSCNVAFGNVTVGGSAEVPVTFTNSGSSTITISSQNKNGPWAFSVRGLSLPYTLGAGQKVAFTVVFAPHTLHSSTCTFTFSSNAANSTVALTASGTGVVSGGLRATPAVLGFGQVPLGSSSTQSVTVTNNASSSVTLSQVSLSSNVTSDPFSLSGFNPPITLSGGQSFTFSVGFAPNAIGNESGMIQISTSDGTPVTLAESGAGIAGGQLAVSPAALNFGSVVVGSKASQNLSLSATSSSVTVTSDALSNSEYSVSGVSFPITLAAGQSVPVTVTFQPQSSGAANASVTFGTSIPGAASTVAAATLNGTGTTAPQHNVSLNWQASTSQIVGYNVYRAGQSGGPYSKVSSALDASTAYSDAAVQAGSTYYYVVTAMDGSGNESVYSNQAQASVPTP